ncbi:hemerythrin domain-containing protein [Blastococcus brunescens]|uniref:Hemerythrin domain-containing protein n=1 Tax=Blastococcus brunescens TaxID=1564165 RepID=A0ABZ1AV35_9ACTN|nr:hemerythrin domain-containing protein [Blastococcus sp. BMG 8361]WRL62309.1 hemerythrin domain-containing protein [Blastococcus sp. BMG 8361]
MLHDRNRGPAHRPDPRPRTAPDDAAQVVGPGAACRAVSYQRVLHQLVRRELRLLADLTTWAPADEAERTGALTRHADLVSRVLLHHHAVEREAVWPALLRAAPVPARDAVEDWTSRCARIDHMLRDVATAARQWQVAGTDPARRAFASACRALADIVEAQTLEEERTLLPLLADHLAAEDWAAIAASSHCRLSGPEQLFVLGLALEDACAGDRARLLGGCRGPSGRRGGCTAPGSTEPPSCACAAPRRRPDRRSEAGGPAVAAAFAVGRRHALAVVADPRGPLRRRRAHGRLPRSGTTVGSRCVREVSAELRSGAMSSRRDGGRNRCDDHLRTGARRRRRHPVLVPPRGRAGEPWAPGPAGGAAGPRRLGRPGHLRGRGGGGHRRPLPVALVAQSMGGLTAPLVCERVPVQLLVLLNAMVPRPGETGGEWWTATGQGPAAAAYRQQLGLPEELDDDATYVHDVPADVAARYMDQEFAQSGRPFEDPWPLDRWPDVPTRVVAGREDRLFPLEFQRKVAAERLGLEVDEVPGGHCAALSRPVELADRLEGYLRSM